MYNKLQPRQAYSITTSSSHVNLVNAADPRYITFIVGEETQRMKRIIRFNPRVLDLDKLNTARKGVFETNETLEHILSFLPAKNIFGVRRVSKHWNDVIATSIHLQEKMFLRLENKPHDIWTLDAKHKAGANEYGDRFGFLNDTELKLRRVDVASNSDTKDITPVTLNPMLRQNDTSIPNVLRMHLDWARIEMVNFTGWADAFRHDESGLWNTYLTDPPCHRAEITSFTLHFGKAPSVTHHAGLQRWKSANTSMEAGYLPKEHPLKSHPITAEVSLQEVVDLQSDVGLTLGDALKAAFQTRGNVCCKFSDWTVWEHVDSTMHDTIDVVERKLGVESVSKSSYVELHLFLFDVGSTTLLIPTEEDRVAANANWKPSH